MQTTGTGQHEAGNTVSWERWGIGHAHNTLGASAGSESEHAAVAPHRVVDNGTRGSTTPALSPARAQHEPLLRVHRFRLREPQAEVRRVEDIGACWGPSHSAGSETPVAKHAASPEEERRISPRPGGINSVCRVQTRWHVQSKPASSR